MTVGTAKKLVASGKIPAEDSVVLCVTGLKTLDAVQGRVGKPDEIKPSLREFEELIESDTKVKLSNEFENGSNVRIPTPLRKLTNEQETVEVESATIGTAGMNWRVNFPESRNGSSMRRANSPIRRVYVNEEDIRFLENQDTPLKDGDDVSIIPAIAGG